MSNKKPAYGKQVLARPSAPGLQGSLLLDIHSLIYQTRDVTARAVNSALVLLYWSIGDRIRRDIPREERAEYGEEILQTLSAKLAAEYGRFFRRCRKNLVSVYGNGCSVPNLSRMVRFAEIFPDKQIVSALPRQLHFLFNLILYESAETEQVELLQLRASGIRLATYLTELPPKAVLQRKLHKAAQLARERLQGTAQ